MDYEEPPRERVVTFLIGYVVLVNLRLIIKNLFGGSLGFEAEPRLSSAVVLSLACAAANIVGAFGLLGWRKWAAWLLGSASCFLAFVYLLCSGPWFGALLVLATPLFLIFALRPQWKYMD
jgi:hypothetical protein